jgi:uncharacterized integral membrane protein
MKIWVGVVVFALLVAIFALQNSHAIPVAFLWWTFRGLSFAVVIILSVLLGAVVGMVAGLWEARRRMNRGPMATAAEDAPGPSDSHDGRPSPLRDS